MGEKREFGSNSIDVIRLVAAIIVMLSHSFRHFGFEKPIWTLCFTDGSVGVIVFFTISGYLIAASWERCLRPGRYTYLSYLWNRFLRIYPLLILNFFVIVVFDYWLYGVTFDSIKTFVGMLGRWLFIRLYEPIPGGISNDVIWTLRNEIVLYFVYPLAYPLFKKLSEKGWFLVIFVFWLFNVFDARICSVLPTIHGNSFMILAYEFLIGIFIYFYKDKILPFISSRKFLVPYGICWMMWFCFYSYFDYVPKTGIMHNSIIGLTLPWLVMGLSYAFGKIRLKIDISYGIFLWHMVVISVMIHLGFTMWYHMICAWIITVVVSFCTYYTIEVPALTFKIRAK